MVSSLLLLCSLLHSLPSTTAKPTTTTTYSSIQISNHNQHHHQHNNNEQRITTSSSPSSSSPSILIINGLRDQLTLAGELLAQSSSTPPPPVVQCHCQDFCGGRCFAPGCHTCTTTLFDGNEFLCLASGPFGGGLLCQGDSDSHDGTEVACCQPEEEDATTVCRIIEGRECDCANVPPMIPLFPSPPDRRYIDGKCTSSETTTTRGRKMEFVGGGGGGTITSDTLTSPTLPMSSYYGTIGI
eukprot:CAMPEP_0198255418 /NCGR_PEP_ID=MMETSP1447-20131203/5544_1 /TAXON_ID=420782 /ORGANISM="Chaetoceros dichaeta, Strain CCMP1751" /LENGTH=240 /DNA_ID=CAMNT_0043941781 /DNA_START=35 /DNA_END=754 /DNA_ORIENTATION=-